jgi:hypothetical protein
MASSCCTDFRFGAVFREVEDPLKLLSMLLESMYSGGRDLLG